jgi:hypothetical protein
MSILSPRLARNYESIQQRIAAAARRSGRSPDSVTLIAVTKYAGLDAVRELVRLGATQLGESRPQQLVERAALLDSRVQWHLIGHLQRNKARRLLPLVTLTHSVDTWRLLAALERLAQELAIQPRLLLEVNLTGEPTKSGFAKDELIAGWDAVCACRHVRVEGLMTMAADSPDPETARPTFAALRELRNHLVQISPPALRLPELSMGMTGDFEVAIEEGATLVRIGSALFEGVEPAP